MPNLAVKLKPGVNTTSTPALLEAGYASASWTRWRDGLPEKMGGFTKFYPSALSGTPKAMTAWQTVAGDQVLAVGTTSYLGAIISDQLDDITPQIATTNPAEDFTTTNGSPTVTVVDTGLTEVTTGNFVYFVTPIAVGGLVLQGVYQIATRVSATSYTITAASNATSSVSNGGAVPSFATTAGSDSVEVTLAAHGLAVGDTFDVNIDVTVGGLTITAGVYIVKTAPTADTFTIQAPNLALSTTSAAMNSGNARLTYYIAVGPNVLLPTTFGMLGFGALGQFGIGDAGSGIPSIITPQTGTPITATDWTLDNFGSFLVGCPENGALYYWIPGRGMNTAAVMSADAPLFNTGCFVSQGARIVVAYGSTANESIGITQDPLLVRWCDQEDFTVWTPSVTNYAGSYRVPTGSKIVGGLSTRQTDLLWTDIDVHGMQYIGGQGSTGGVSLVYAFNRLGTNCGLIGKHAATSFQGGVYWMGYKNFFRLSGEGVQIVPCSVWDAVFQDIDTDNQHKSWCTGITPFNEIIWFFPSESGGTGECDRYVKLNITNGLWDYGPISGSTSIARTCGIDQSVLGMPIMASPTGYVYQHETTYNADGAAISWSYQTGDFVLSEARDFPFVDLIWPDFKYQTFDGSTTSATISLTIYGKDAPNDTPRTYGPYTVTAATEYINCRFRNRLMSLKVSGDDLNTWSRLGNVRLRVAPSGRR